jgi:aminoglycoside phosphotransferase family enzyme
VAIFNLCVFDDDHKEEDILYDVAYSIVELERERRYYKLCSIPVNSEKIDLIDIGLPVVEVIPSLMSWQEFPDTFRKIDIDDTIDTTDIYDRLFEKLI